MSDILILEIPRGLTIGIDTFSLEVKAKQPIYGISKIPSGIHVIHFQHDELRYGYWFTHGNFIIKWNTETELYEMCEEKDLVKFENSLNDYISRNLVLKYPSIDEWFRLIEYIDWVQVCHIMGGKEKEGATVFYSDSSMSTAEETEILRKRLKNSNDDDDKIFDYTTVRFKSREAIRSDHQMEDFLDKSYYFNEIIMKKRFHGKISMYLGELQFAYLNSILFGNYGSSLQWHNLIELICGSSIVDTEYMSKLDSTLSVELKILPIEYIDILINDDMWIRSLNKSFQKERLPLTKREMQLKKPEFVNNSREGESEEEEDPYDRSFLLQEEDDSEDEYKPTVVSGIYYERSRDV
ncbi:hypothetical protein KAFR_0K01850 [Kazachstania africana CBS 2517]|uniref:A1 cistron-splicing factor AAR2 n=1 Tax=Kazachstania africana (strain ATCC 22294 / BCRC 22015 / CBS 2517 / CECT 1963 / NBRC 1671 / NRRL Y-8276) TaxID=1071382 RepID=H2B1N9_KAZAF|nr:hypothetical protein KAFR_0K01850 [Kazachstania africana CBS 2517]CCF60539.1 hypothetical protein KAFR_0K01850 [Kazachstania africana CBS 2517]